MPDTLTVSAVAWARVVIATAVAAAGSIPDTLSDRHRALFLFAGLVWVPWSVVVLFASETQGRRVALVGGPLGDLVVLFACQVLAPGSAEAVLSGYLVVVAFAAYTLGRRVAGLLAGGALTLTLLAWALAKDADRIAAGVIAMFAISSVAIVVLIQRTSLLQQREAQRAARLQSASDAVLARIADGVVVTDDRGIVRSCNPAAERLLGARARDLVGSPCYVALALRDGESRFDCSTGCRLLATAGPLTDELGQEVWRPDADRRLPILANATPVLDADGTIVEVVHSMRDITKLKQSEEAKTLFLATASHELKTPLTVIRGFVETLLSTEMDPERRQLALDAVHRRALELGNIVDRLLLSSRIEAGRVDLLVGNVELLPLLAERAAALGAATGRVVDIDLDDDIGFVRGDDAALATVFEHLIDNAIKYSPGGGSIRVEAFKRERVIVTVSDDGIGMSADHAAHCFDKFWQAEAGDVRRFGGTGIGLYIVRSLVDAMGGRISVESALDEGTTFAVELLPGGEQRASAADRDEHDGDDASEHDGQRGVGETTMIREFMRQIGVAERRPA
ncbi:MAG: two-component system, OmpR family, phosphate regulon sensor histidine kinase PhoR [Actinomycetota bacterium]